MPLHADMLYSQIKEFTSLAPATSGNSAEEVKSAEQHLNGRIPLALRAYYQYFGNHPVLTNAFHHLIPLPELTLRHGHLVFYRENQGVWIAGIPVEQLTMNGLSVTLSYDEGQTWEPFCESLSEFLTSMSFHQLLAGGKYQALKLETDPGLLNAIAGNWFELEGTCTAAHARFFSDAARSQLVGVFGEASPDRPDNPFHLHVAAATEADYQRLVDGLGVEDWDYTHLDD